MNSNEAFATAKHSPLDYAKSACDSLIAQFTPEELPPARRWHYHQGIFLQGMLEVWRLTGDDQYLQYPKSYVDQLVDEHGSFRFARDELDSIMPGLLLITLDKQFGEQRYRVAADKLRGLFKTLNKTSEGAFWHKDNYPYQMWLDGLYMGGVFAVQYAENYGDEELIPMVIKWEKLMSKHMSDEATGLLYHAWDESRKFPWSNPDTGNSPELWGRSLGWYGLALTEFLEVLPEDHPSRSELKTALGRFVDGLISFQDAKSGLWYQVVDKGHLSDNWLETSCTSLFIYAIVGAVKHGCVGGDRLEAAQRGYQGLIDRLHTDVEGRLVVPDICIGTSAGDYQHYVARPVSDNDLHGVGAFILACVAMESVKR